MVCSKILRHAILHKPSLPLRNVTENDVDKLTDCKAYELDKCLFLLDYATESVTLHKSDCIELLAIEVI